MFLFCFVEQFKEKNQRIQGGLPAYKPRVFMSSSLVQGYVMPFKLIKDYKHQYEKEIGLMYSLLLVLVSTSQ